MLRVGLTGGIASGKTTVCNIFSELGVPVIDADQIAHQLVRKGKPVLKQITEKFGNIIIDANGELDRDAIRDIIFNDKNARKILENILHPLIYNEIEKQVSELNAPYCIICIPLLVETCSENKVDRILVIDVPESTQMKRAVLRDDKNTRDVKKIINSQASRDQRLQAADDIIVNDSDISKLRDQISKLNKKYNKLSAKFKTNYTDIDQLYC